MSKRKADENSDNDNDVQEESGNKRRRSRSSEPLQDQTRETEKREVLRRLYTRSCTVNEPNNDPPNTVEEVTTEGGEITQEETVNQYVEIEDPLLDFVPANMDPGQLGFLVCAQEALRFLHVGGITSDNPIFIRLRSRLIEGIYEIAAA